MKKKWYQEIFYFDGENTIYDGQFLNEKRGEGKEMNDEKYSYYIR